MERIKLSLKTRDAPEPVARSCNRPADVIRLTTSNLPELSWAATAAPPALDVNDLLDLLSPSAPTSSAAGQQQQQQQQQYPSSSLPAYQPKYTLSSREGQDKHALFFNNSSSGAAVPPPPSSYSASWGGTSGSQRYPQVADVRLPPPALLDQAQMQRLQLGPSAGPTLGPQEIEVGQGQPWVHRG